MTTSIRITSLHRELGIRFESGVRRYDGVILSGFLKVFQDRLSLSGWLLKIDYLRMFEWGNGRSHKDVCYVGEREESRDHLFFACPITLLGFSASPDWSTMVASRRRQRQNNLDVILLKMVFHTIVYTTWQERNSRWHQGVWLTMETMIRRIDKAIKSTGFALWSTQAPIS